MNKLERHEHRWSIFWPLLLIGVGVILFLNAIGNISATPWEIFLRFWPVLFIIGGLDSLFRRDLIVFSILEIGVGVAFQLSILGYITGLDWFQVIRLWPVILIAIALDILIGRRRPWATLVAVLVGLLLLVGFTFAATRIASTESLVTTPFNQALQGATRANVTISPSVGRLVVSGGADQASVVNAKLNLAQSESLDKNYRIENGTGSLDLESHGNVYVIYPNIGPGNPNYQSWTCRLNSTIPMDLNLNLGIGEMAVNLAEMHPASLYAKLGIGQILLTLPSGGSYNATVNNGIGSTVVYIPKGTIIRIHLETGLAGSSLPKDFTRQGDTAYSPGAVNASNVIDLSVKQDIGSLEIRYLQ